MKIRVRNDRIAIAAKSGKITISREPGEDGDVSFQYREKRRTLASGETIHLYESEAE